MGRTAQDPALSTVTLTVPPEAWYVSIVRNLGATLIARHGATLDEIEDTRIAVDEAFSCALPLASGPLTFTLSAPKGAFHVDIEAAARSDADVPAEDSFAWTVLCALVTSVSASIDTTDGRSVLRMSLAKDLAVTG